MTSGEDPGTCRPGAISQPHPRPIRSTWPGPGTRPTPTSATASIRSTRPALARLPDGPSVFRGLPFALGSRAAGRRWILVDRELAIDLAPPRRASHLVIAHFADSWRDAHGRSPARDAGRLGLPDRRAARPLRDRAGRRPDDRARRPAPFRGRRRDHRLGVPAVRGDRAPRRRDARLARPVSAPGRRAATRRRATAARSPSCPARGAPARPVSPTRCRRPTTT